jgi:hypothetical protein
VDIQKEELMSPSSFGVMVLLGLSLVSRAEELQSAEVDESVAVVSCRGNVETIPKVIVTQAGDSFTTHIYFADGSQESFPSHLVSGHHGAQGLFSLRPTRKSSDQERVMDFLVMDPHRHSDYGGIFVKDQSNWKGFVEHVIFCDAIQGY